MVGSSRWKIQVLSRGCDRALKSFPSRGCDWALKSFPSRAVGARCHSRYSLWLPSMLSLPQHQDVLCCSGVSPALQQINPSAVFLSEGEKVAAFSLVMCYHHNYV